MTAAPRATAPHRRIDERNGRTTTAAAARSAVVWGARYGVPGLAIRLAARRGDVVARSAVEPAAIADPAILFDELYALGPMATTPLVHATAHHAIATEVLRNPAFDVGPGKAAVPLIDRAVAAAIDPRTLGVVDPPSLLAVPPPQHARLRKLVSQAFTPRVIAGWADRIETIAHDLLDRAGDRFDLIDDFAAELPLTVIAEIMGVPDELRPVLLGIGNDAALTLDPALSWRDYRRAEASIREGADLIDEQVALLRATPGQDLMSQLVRANADGDTLSDTELRVNTLLLIGAGFETTVNLIGNAVALLLEHPDQLARLQADPAGWPTAVDEVLRYDSPVQLTVRGVRQPVEVGGVELKPGRMVLVMLGAANRDPAVFPDPARFDVTRTEARQHLAFSSGAHFCVGAQLARLEASVALRVLFERHPDLARREPGKRRRTRVLRGWEHLPVAA